ncbi:unnamed protein product [Rhizoctonia solani]|uniref:WD40 repeat-like protein n=1 Tax=Rhizoctonia solani TaxID=456999 RepID=A0A8H2XAD9_9AGAM|nr:unnamed protein product [Rhizoctonia solani]
MALESSLALGMDPFECGIVQTAVFSPTDLRIFSSSHSCGILIWDSHDGSLVANITRGRPHSTCSSTVSHDLTCHAVFLDDYTVQILSTEATHVVAGPFKGHTDLVTTASFSRDNTRIVTGSKDRTVRVWNIHSGELAHGPFVGHVDEILSVTFSFNGFRVVSYAKDKSIRIWNLQEDILGVDTPVCSGGSPSSPVPSAFESWAFRDDGWATNRDSSLLLWFPTDLASAPSPHTELIITGTGSLIIAEQKLLLGNEWSKCYIPA